MTIRFAVSLQTLCDRLFESQRGAEAVAAAREAIAAYQHAAASSGANLPAIGGQLFSLSTRLSSSGALADAVVALVAAADILRPVAMTDEADAPIRALLAAELLALAMRLLDAGRRDEARAAARELVTVSHHAAEAEGANHGALASDLFTMSNQFLGAGLLADAVDPIDAATDIMRGPASEDDAPAATRESFAIFLLTLTRRLADAGRNREAHAAVEECLLVYRRLAEENPAAFGPSLQEAERVAATLGA